MKRPDSSDIRKHGGLWVVNIHRDVAKTIAQHARDDAFRPSLAELLAQIERDPKGFPKKKGSLRDYRAASLRFADGVSWRAVFAIDDKERTVFLLALAPHDRAYRDAETRRS